jgi:hypothetical protein
MCNTIDEKKRKEGKRKRKTIAPDPNGLGRALLVHFLHLLPCHVNVKVFPVLWLGRERGPRRQAYRDVNEVQVQVL